MLASDNKKYSAAGHEASPPDLSRILPLMIYCLPLNYAHRE
jgi:hypothetical protein